MRTFDRQPTAWPGGTRRFLAWMVAVVAAGGPAASAQWVVQTVQLEEGWNSVSLHVDPAPSDAAAVFGGAPVVIVWTPLEQLYADRPSACADPDHPDCVPMSSGDWQVWVPPADPASVVNSLDVISGGRVYLVKASAPAVLAIKGRPNGRGTEWRAGFNLAGFHVVEDPEGAPTFAAYLAPSAPHASAQIYETSADGSVAQIADPEQTRITPGRGYWVRSSRAAEYDGPIGVDYASLRGINYALGLSEHFLTIKNMAAVQGDVTVRRLDSASPPPSGGPWATVAGNVPLMWRGLTGDPTTPWGELASSPWQPPPDQAGAASWSIRLAVSRAGLAEAIVNADGSGSQYQSILEITDGQGYRRLLGVVAQASGPAGLWAGQVTVNEVSWVTAPASDEQDSQTPRPTPAAFSFPIIIHRGEPIAYSMLTEVTMMWKPGATPETPGRFVLVTPEVSPAVLAQLEAGSRRDGEPFSYRMSTAAFSFAGHLALTGGFDSVLHGQVSLSSDPTVDRLNPFTHRYHPDHDCDQEGECYDITREFDLVFDTSPPSEALDPAWGDSLLTGRYEEQVTGLHRDTINAAGRFELRRVSRIPALNGQ